MELQEPSNQQKKACHPLIPILFPVTFKAREQRNLTTQPQQVEHQNSTTEIISTCQWMSFRNCFPGLCSEAEVRYEHYLTSSSSFFNQTHRAQLRLLANYWFTSLRCFRIHYKLTKKKISGFIGVHITEDLALINSIVLPYSIMVHIVKCLTTKVK